MTSKLGFSFNIHLGEYDQNKCTPSDPSCVPCDKRLPSCVSQQDGAAPVQWKLWKPEYTQCLLNRTMARWMKNCTDGYFHPRLLKCMKDVPKGWFYISN